jgi:hypothetical protein
LGVTVRPDYSPAGSNWIALRSLFKRKRKT